MDAVSAVSGSGSSATTSALQRSDVWARIKAENPHGIRVFGVVEGVQERVFGKLDADGDGGVSLDELKGLGGIGAGKNDPAAFAALDGDGDKKLSLRELQASSLFSPSTLGELLTGQSGQGLNSWLVAEGDGDGDGALSLEEFRAVGPTGEFKPRVLADGTVSQDPLDQIIGKADRAFAAADADQDGKVTAEELSAVTAMYGRPLSLANNAAIAATLMSQDLDDSGGLSKAELADQIRGIPEFDAVFSKLDTDGDSEVSQSELAVGVAIAKDFRFSPAAPMTTASAGQQDVPVELTLLRIYSQAAKRLVAEMAETAKTQMTLEV